MQFSARKLLSFTTDQLWDMLTGDFTLVFDDGQMLPTNDRHTLYSSYFWDFHRLYVKTPLLIDHHVQHMLKGSKLSSKTHIELLSRIYWDTMAANQEHKEYIRDHLTRLVYEVTNHLYNDMIRKTESSIMSIDILDFIQINNHPAVQQAFSELTPTAESIDKTYKTILKTFDSDKSVSENSLVRAVQSKMVNANQVLQCVGPRGFVSEVDGSIMANPVMRSYTQGMDTLYNVLAESRTAARGLYFSESPLQDSEYFSRRLQLVCMSVEKLYRGDCGSQRYVQWRIKPAVKVGDKEIYPGDLKFLVGKFYLDDQTQSLKVIQKTDTHLIGKTVKMRSVLHCQHPDAHQVCATCFGELSENIFDHMNLGHICAATMTQQSTQSVLSTKHLDASSSSDPIKFSDELEKFFEKEERTTNYILKSSLKSRKLKLALSPTELYGFTDILTSDRIEDMDPSRLSSIKDVGFVFDTIDESTPYSVHVEQNGRSAILTTDFLKYAKQYRWTLNTSSAYIFDLSNWDFSKTIFQLPNMEYSYAKHSKQIADIIESKMKELNNRNSPESPVRTLSELFDMVNSKISVNIALLEVIIYAMMTYNQKESNMYLARNSPDATLGVRDSIIHNRSMSGPYAFESQFRAITDPRSFFIDNRPDHPLDVFFAPQEVLSYKQK